MLLLLVLLGLGVGHRPEIALIDSLLLQLLRVKWRLLHHHRLRELLAWVMLLEVGVRWRLCMVGGE